MKKVLRYMQDQATLYSDPKHKYSNGAYLSSNGKEPQQRTYHPNHYKSQHQTHATRRASHPSALAHSIPHHTSGASGPHPIPHDIQRIQYGSDNIHQSYEIYIPNSTPNAHCAITPSYLESTRDSPPSYDQHHTHPTEPPATPSGASTPPYVAEPTAKYWIIYLHGGYFRDPSVTSTSFHPALSQLINPHHPSPQIRNIQPHIAGYASINYRLSPHERYPQGEDTVEYEKRNAKWPQQLEDVISALRHLQSKWGMGERYALVGHSVGATMAMLASLRCEEEGVKAPMAVVGVCGIYDFGKLHEVWRREGYEGLTRNAGISEEGEGEASPGRVGRGEWEGRWARGRKRWVVLGQGRGDGLVDFEQGVGMQGVFDQEDGSEGGSGLIMCDLMKVEGRHNEVWEKGDELVRVIGVGVGEMMGLDQ